jgi:tryptophan-rich sensory protein
MGGGASYANWHPWMDTLRQAPFCPSEFTLADIWGGLYLLMAVAGWLVWRAPDVAMHNLRALVDWGWLLVLKSIGICIMFGAHFLLATAAVNIMLLFAVGRTIWRFWPLNQWAAALMLPYALWTGTEIYLSLGSWWLNS